VSDAKAPTVYTIGHGTRAANELVQALAAAGVELLLDVRAYPRSRTNPQFNSDALAPVLAAAGIEYQHRDSLGGRRRGLGAQSPNVGWTHPAFRSYADYMMTAEFWSALDLLLEEARSRMVAIMCSETLWWRCHRRMIADALVSRAALVKHIMKPGVLDEHDLSPPARVVGGRLTYH
jgi:uncharacterized protein (DUF488 family)